MQRRRYQKQRVLGRKFVATSDRKMTSYPGQHLAPAASDSFQLQSAQRSSKCVLAEKPMLAKCANPDCSMQFKYFREGKLFEFVVTAEGKQCLDGSPPPKQSVRELFWLCAECSRQ